ncbi:hypothetical protein COCMIDRAFT_26154 [Bipolaris oryzae ATCC 44560]|uniref:Uncharacterized protein n=1 Tax=Bipolaris oryzae ATCC 44560 TaxID=930090 RepID=W6Z1U5_COCMI|nr:uncharacterized protein COCMIDRAFT_26154 [Bipolaris oryzae ATCC 44560]EUC45702.1 hypothetical protein COCMIDRAFT_26154 [Bipolaris oryzae ATCC 44560]
MCRCLKRGVQQLAWRVGAATPMLQMGRRRYSRNLVAIACTNNTVDEIAHGVRVRATSADRHRWVGRVGGSDSEGPSRAARVGVEALFPHGGEAHSLACRRSIGSGSGGRKARHVHGRGGCRVGKAIHGLETGADWQAPQALEALAGMTLSIGIGIGAKARARHRARTARPGSFASQGPGWPGDGVTASVIRPTWLAVSAAVGLVETGPMPEAGRGACWIMEREGGSRILRLHGAWCMERRRGASQGDKHCLQSEKKLGAAASASQWRRVEEGVEGVVQWCSGAVVLLDATRSWPGVGCSWPNVMGAHPCRACTLVAECRAISSLISAAGDGDALEETRRCRVREQQTMQTQTRAGNSTHYRAWYRQGQWGWLGGWFCLE